MQETMQPAVIYNALDRRYKSIRGGVSEGAVLTVRIGVHKSVKPSSVSFVYRKIDDCLFICDDMESDGVEGDYFLYKTQREWKRGIYIYRFTLNGVDFESEVGLDGQKAALYYDKAPCWQLTVYSRKYDVPVWARGKIIYQIFPDRFYSSGDIHVKDGMEYRRDWGNLPDYLPVDGKILNNDVFGGNLRGIIEKLDYLKSLNVGIIYLNPIFEASSNHRYDTSDYMKIDSTLGKEEDFDELVKKASDLGINVILDGVFNHTGSDSLYFDKLGKRKGGAYGNPDSKYRDWYLFDKDSKYKCWWNIPTLPTLNGESESLQKFFCAENGVVRKWLKAGARGWRLDVVDELCDGMLNRLVEAAKAEKTDCLIIGEVWEDASNKISYGQRREYFLGEQLDSVMNYPLKNAIIEFVRTGNVQKLSNVNFYLQDNYPKHVVDCLMNIMGTHDTERIINALAGVDTRCMSRTQKAKYRLTFEQYKQGSILVRLAAVLQYTLPGIPSVYYGDEVGMQGCNDPFNRGCFPWNSGDRNLPLLYRKLGEIRRKRIFEDGEFNELIAKDGLYCFERVSESERVVVAVNRGSKAILLEIVNADACKDSRAILDGENKTTLINGFNSESVISRYALIDDGYVDLLTDESVCGSYNLEPDSAVVLYKKLK
ncbi:MAG: glycoside hydrolase family 13 protein [Clostridia bacterium]|nr:glycoside hydrolase family 13 protein [Clostridia bacterium]